MRRLLARLKPLHLEALAVSLGFAAWKGPEYARGWAKSPFALWGFRAGMPFAELDKHVFQRTQRHFGCQEILESARLCELRTVGIPGQFRVLVDDAGRIARLQFLPDSASPFMREEGHRIAAYWNQVRDGIGDASNAPGRSFSTTRWSSADKRWSALIRYGRLGRTPTDIQLIDRRRLSTIALSTALAPVALVMNAAAESTDVGAANDATYALRNIQSGQALDASYETPIPASEVLVPACVRARSPVNPQWSQKPNEAPAAEALIDSALAKAYSGSRLVIGDTTWLVGVEGKGERIRLAPVDGDESERVVAVAVQFGAREHSAITKLREGPAESYCRATADLLVAQALPNGALGNVYRIPIAEDAIVSQISQVHVVPQSPTDKAHIRLRYTTLYATLRWVASMSWEGIVDGDPPRLRSRAPLGFEQISDDASAPRAGTLLITRRTPTSISLGTLERQEWGYASRSVVVPIAPSGVLEPVRLLDRLLSPKGPR